jgi:hypothetical protein
LAAAAFGKIFRRKTLTFLHIKLIRVTTSCINNSKSKRKSTLSQKNVENLEPSEIEKLRQEASEAVISANINPTLLSQEEHRRVSLAQAVASRAIIEANSMNNIQRSTPV